MVDVNRVIGRLVDLMQDAHLAVGLHCSCEDSVAEVLLCDYLRAAEGEEDATGLDALQSFDVEACVAFEGVAQGCAMLGECGRVEHDEVIGLVVGIEELERVLAEGCVTLVAGEVEGDVPVGELDGFCAAVDGVDEFCSATHGVNGEAARVAEHVEDGASFGVGLEQVAVLALVDEEAGLLSFQPVDVEVQAVLHSHVAAHRAVNEAVLVLYVCLKRERCLALVVDVLYLAFGSSHKSLAYLMANEVHTNAVCLHDCGVAIAVDDETGEVVALAVHKAERIVVLSADESDSLTHLPSRLQAREPELAVYLDIAERQHAHCDRTDLIHADSDEVALRGEYAHDFAFFYAVFDLGYGSREYPGVKALEAFLLTFL